VESIYLALAVLATEYWEMKTAIIAEAENARARCTSRIQELGLELSPSISAAAAGKEGSEYFVAYPVGTESKRMLELHLKKGSDRDESNCLRIYFFWDSELLRVVIGWLPSHLATDAT
jgi:hypothetical protein